MVKLVLTIRASKAEAKRNAAHDTILHQRPRNSSPQEYVPAARRLSCAMARIMPQEVFHLLSESVGGNVESTQEKLPYRRTLGTSTVRRTLTRLRTEGPRAILLSIEPDIHRLIGQRPVSGFRRYVGFFSRKRGIEIGGPSPIFSKGALLPVYPLARSIDNFNIIVTTSDDNSPSRSDSQLGQGEYTNHLVTDGANLGRVPDASFDFVISSHTLEHFSNPIKALYEWKRILKPGGVMLLCLPHKEGTFDHRRPTTSVEHLIEDYTKDTSQNDLTHLQEALDLVDLTRTYGVSRKEFVEMSSKNPDSRYLHHHTFVTESVLRMVDSVGLEILDAFAHRPFHAIALCRKTDLPVTRMHEDNLGFLSEKARWRRKSPFKLDRE